MIDNFPGRSRKIMPLVKTSLGGSIIDITDKKIEGLKTTGILSEVVKILKDCSPDICIAGGAVLDAVSLQPWGKNENTDLDFWMTVKDVDTSTEDLNRILKKCSGPHYTKFGVLFTKLQRQPVNIINIDKECLEDILLSFDTAACQVGLRVVEGKPQLLCTEGFLECMKTGKITWWNFAQGNIRRIRKYHNKKFALADHLLGLMSYSVNLKKYSPCQQTELKDCRDFVIGTASNSDYIQQEQSDLGKDTFSHVDNKCFRIKNGFTVTDGIIKAKLSDPWLDKATERFSKTTTQEEVKMIIPDNSTFFVTHNNYWKCKEFFSKPELVTRLENCSLQVYGCVRSKVCRKTDSCITYVYPHIIAMIENC